MFSPVVERDHPSWDGIQKIYRFVNGYGASVIRSTFSYGGPAGLWELAVIRFINEKDNLKFDLDYSTPITDDVLGHLSDAEVEEQLAKISEL